MTMTGQARRTRRAGCTTVTHEEVNMNRLRNLSIAGIILFVLLVLVAAAAEIGLDVVIIWAIVKLVHHFA